MAAFDEAARQRGIDTSPTSTGEYLRWGDKEITTPTYPSARAKAYEGIKEAFQGTEELDKAAGKFAENAGYEAGQNIQSDMGASTEALYQSTFPGKSDSLVATPDNTPKDVKDGIAQAGNIRAARDQGGLPGHIRETEYYKQLYMKASELRARWPGYRDHIDKGFEKATGITPNANQYIKSMLADLNEAAGKKDQDKNKVISELYTLKGAEGMDEHMADVMANKPGAIPEAIKWINKRSAFEYQNKVNKAAVEEMDLDQKRGEQRSRASVNAYVGGLSGQLIDAHRKQFNLTDDELKKWADNPDYFTPEKVDQMNASLTLQERKLDEDTSKHFASVPGVTGEKEYLKEHYAKAVDDAKAPLKAWKEALAGKDFSLLDRYSRLTKALEHKDVYHVFQDKSDTAYIYRSALLAKNMGAGIFQPMLQLPDQDSINILLGKAAGKLPIRGPDSMPESLKLIDEENGGKSPQSVWTYVRGIGMGISSSDSKLTNEQKANLIEHAFKQTDQPWLTSLSSRVYDNARGITTYGREDVYNQFTDPTFRDNVKRIAAETHNDKLYQNYQKWVDNNFFALTKDTINELGNPIGLGATRNLAIKFHPEDKPPRLTWQIGGGVNTPRNPGEYTVGSSAGTSGSAIELKLQNMNDALASLHNTRLDQTSSMLLQSMKNAGFDPSRAPTSAAAAIWRAIEASKAPKEGSAKPQERVGG